jgi:hypothetical protein
MPKRHEPGETRGTQGRRPAKERQVDDPSLFLAANLRQQDEQRRIFFDRKFATFATQYRQATDVKLAANRSAEASTVSSAEPLTVEAYANKTNKKSGTRNLEHGTRNPEECSTGGYLYDLPEFGATPKRCVFGGEDVCNLEHG